MIEAWSPAPSRSSRPSVALHGRRPRAGARLPLPRRRPGAQIALPEVKLGLLPGRGRHAAPAARVGVETALNMIVRGDAVPSAKLEGTQLFDEIARRRPARGRRRVRREGGRREAAAAAGARPQGRRTRTPRASSQFARNTVRRGGQELPGAAQVRRCGGRGGVASRSTRACASSATCSSSWCRHAESQALRHAFFAERAARKIPDVPDDTPMRADQAGGRHRRRHHGRRHRHELRQRRHPGHAAGDEAGGARQGPRHHPQELRGHAQEGQAHAGRGRAAHGAAQAHARATPTLKDADIVIEAVFEDMAVKQKVFKSSTR